MQRIRILLLCFVGISFQPAEGQTTSRNNSTLTITKFICLKTIEKKDLFTVKFNKQDSLSQLRQYIYKTNVLADTGRHEFHVLISGLLEEVKKKSLPISADRFNLYIENYNNSCQIIDYLSLQKIPSGFFEFSKKFYGEKICNPGNPSCFKVFIRTFTKHYNNFRLVSTGDKPFPGKEQAVVTTHNQLEKIIPEINPTFSSFSKKKQIAFQRKVQVVNPWIESFKKGISYNKTQEAFFADDEFLLLIPENQ